MKISFFHTLYFKLAAGLTLILLIIGLSYTVFANYLLLQVNQSSHQLINKNLAENLVNDKKIVNNGKIDIKAMKDTFMQYMSINPSIEIYYLDLQGNILAYSAEPGKVKRNSVNLAPIKNRINNPNNTNNLGDDPRSHDIRKAFSATTIPNATKPEGYLYVVLQGEEITAALNSKTHNTIIYLSGIILAGSLVVGLLIGLYIFYKINIRIKNLQTNVAHFVANDFSSKKITNFESNNLLPKDEISELESNINNMATHIDKQWAALKQQDTLRREMVANISHDLRTPLASIQAYLETLSIKYNVLDNEERQKYIHTMSKQAKGLQKLIDGLFELAKLDAREHEPAMESFPLLELTYDVIAKFEHSAAKKEIILNINSETENPMVFADLGLIERVLDNLISNAIYYSKVNGYISVNIAAPEDGSLTVKISDTGQGIPLDQQALVFERFHQAHTPERTDGHAGLGLCIVKKIIELHKQSIWLESRPEHGAQFNFTLATTQVFRQKVISHY